MNIITNNRTRQFIYGYELTAKERAEFDHMSEEDRQCADFFRYRGQVYTTGDFMCLDHNAPEAFQGWDGYSSDSFFSGVLIKLLENSDGYKIATYLS